MRYHTPEIMPVACPTLPHSQRVGQDSDRQDKKATNMLCMLHDKDTPHIRGGDVTSEDSELEIIFEGDADCCDEIEDEEDTEATSDEESEDEYAEDEFEEEEDDEEGIHSNCQDTPFWFSYEDTDQICGILNSYSKTLDLEEERKSCVRAPPPFIGKVKRVQVDADLFTTLDQVSIYLRDVRPLGISLPFSRDEWLLTSWDVAEGVPLRSFRIKDESLIEFWQSRAHGDVSYLYCRPVYHTKSCWEFEVSSYDLPVVYASPFYSATHSFNLYLPKRVEHPSALDESLV